MDHLRPFINISIGNESIALRQQDKIVNLIRHDGILRYRDLTVHNVHPEILSRLVRTGEVIRIGRGLYTLPDMELPSGFQTYAEATKKIPHGVICLLSALAFHEMTTQAPFEVWVAIGEKSRLPKVEHIQIRFVRFSSELLDKGVQKHMIRNIPVKITNPARTVADCFKYRNKIGLDVAIEALKDGLRNRRFTVDELWQFAELCRVARVIRPYIEAVT